MSDAKFDASIKQSSGLGCLLRMIWLLAGNAAAFLSGVWIALNAGKAFFTVVDIVYMAGVFAVVLSRYLDIRYFQGTTGTGEPATIGHWRKHAAFVISGSLVAWVIAHGIAFLLTK
jgi:hypothetical protein